MIELNFSIIMKLDKVSKPCILYFQMILYLCASSFLDITASKWWSWKCESVSLSNDSLVRATTVLATHFFFFKKSNCNQSLCVIVEMSQARSICIDSYTEFFVGNVLTYSTMYCVPEAECNFIEVSLHLILSISVPHPLSVDIYIDPSTIFRLLCDETHFMCSPVRSIFFYSASTDFSLFHQCYCFCFFTGFSYMIWTRLWKRQCIDHSSWRYCFLRWMSTCAINRIKSAVRSTSCVFLYIQRGTIWSIYISKVYRPTVALLRTPLLMAISSVTPDNIEEEFFNWTIDGMYQKKLCWSSTTLSVKKIHWTVTTVMKNGTIARQVSLIFTFFTNTFQYIYFCSHLICAHIFLHLLLFISGW